jgi:hypothetical protein
MSQLRRCDRWLATDGKWYLALGDDEHCYDDDECTFYGPFESNDDIEGTLSHFPNTSSECLDNSGTKQPPKEVTAPINTKTGRWTL